MIEWIVSYDDDGNEEVHGELVRCKDCKYAHLTYDGDCKYCDIMTENADGESFPLYLPGDWYCADGERREVKE